MTDLLSWTAIRPIQRVALVYPVATFMPPLGLITLATLLERLGKKVIVVPLYAGAYSPGASMLEAQLKRLKDFRPDMIGVGFMSAERHAAQSVMAALHHHHPQALLVAGGRHPSCFPEEVLGWGADCVIVGEGETTLMELVQALEHDPARGPEIEGLAFMDGEGEMRFRPRLEESADLDVLPAYHLIPYQSFINMRSAVTGRNLKAGWVATSRGCFSRCIYCRDTNFGGKLRVRSMDGVMADIELQAKQYDLDSFYVIDDMFAVNETRVLEFCRRFREVQRRLNKKLLFAATSRTDTLTPAMVVAMKEAGCTQLSIGVESGSQRVHDFLRTGKKVSTVIPAFDMLKGSGIDTFINLIVGVPIEQEDDILLTLKLIERINPTTVGVSFLTAYPGTPLFDMALQRKWLTSERIEADTFQHTSGMPQLDSGIDRSLLQQRMNALYGATFFHTLGSLVRRPSEVLHLALGTLSSFGREPATVLRMIVALLGGDVQRFKRLYRDLVFARGGLLKLLS